MVTAVIAFTSMRTAVTASAGLVADVTAYDSWMTSLTIWINAVTAFSPF